MTEAFGPVGLGWGYTATFEDTHLSNGMSCNWCMLSAWYYPNGCTGTLGSETDPLRPIGPRTETISQVGGTLVAGTYSSGKEYLDDDARKKSLTDALLKWFSHIGIGGDIHLGMMDDSKYVSERKAEEAQEQTKLDKDAAQADAAELVEHLTTCQDAAVFRDELLPSAKDLRARLRAAGLKVDHDALVKTVGDAAARFGIDLKAAA
jgi:hypothetical protein